MACGCSGSAIYGCGYSSRGFNLRLSEDRSGTFDFDLGPLGPQTGSKSTPNDPHRTSDSLQLQPQIADWSPPVASPRAPRKKNTVP